MCGGQPALPVVGQPRALPKDQEEFDGSPRSNSSSHKRLDTRRPQQLLCPPDASRSYDQVARTTPKNGKEYFEQEGQAVIAASPLRTPLTSVSHLEVWHEARESLIVLDWDDTLFPTAHVWNDERLHWDQMAPCLTDGGDRGMPTDPSLPEGPTLLEQLMQHASTVAALLRLAVSLGHVVILTMAQEGWVQRSISNFLPSLEGLLEELAIEVVYAGSTCPARFVRQSHEDGQDLTKILKTRAMQRIVKEFYGTGRRGGRARSWKNVISIGDSPGERLALQDVIFRRKQVDSKGDMKKCRCKTLKFLSEPSLERLTAELQVVMTWLHSLVLHDGDIDLDFGELDEDSPLPYHSKAQSDMLDSPALPMRNGDGFGGWMRTQSEGAGAAVPASQ